MSIDVYLVLAGIGAVLAGLVRGYSGFGSSMVLVPILALLYNPQFAVVSAVILELFACIQLVPGAISHCHWRSVIPMSLASVFAVPLGALLLVNLEATTLQQCLALVILASVALLARKRQSNGKQSRSLTSAYITGASSGVVSGATSLGGVPIILYYLSGNLSAPVARASMVVFLVVTTLTSLLAFVFHGIVSEEIVLFCAKIALPFIIATWLGKRLFGTTSESTFRTLTLIFLGGLGLLLLFV